MKYHIILLLLILFFASCKKNIDSKSDKPAESMNDQQSNYIGNSSRAFEIKVIPGEVPDFCWYNEKNQINRLSDLKGKVIVINFWATWCSPCRSEIPTIISVYNHNKSKGVVFLGISVDQEISLSELASFVGENGINYQVILDEGLLEDSFGGISAIPTTIIIDKNFKISDKITGELSAEKIQGLIDKVY